MLPLPRIPLLAASLCAAAAAQTTPSVDDLVAKNTAARGGAAKIKAIRSLRITARGIAAGGLEVPMTVTVKRPGLMRAESNIQGQTTIQAFDGRQSWSVNPLVGINEPAYAGEAESRNARERAASMLDGRLMDYKANGTKIELAGREDIEGKPAYKLRITTKDGVVVHEWLSAETWLGVKSTTTVMQSGQEILVDAYMRDFRPEGGMIMAHTVDQRIGTLPGLKMVFEKVEINVPLDDTLFQLPGMKP
jgi:outer membrane lipoprotein-sorting protein